MRALSYFYSAGTHFRLVLSSGRGEEQGANLRLGLLGHQLTVNLPQWVLRPSRRWVDTSRYSWSTNPAGGYWQLDAREYGTYLYENHFNLLYGLSTDDSSTEQRWSCFLPWAEWRHVRYETLGLDRQVVEVIDEKDGFERQLEASKRAPKVRFSFKDFDGEGIEATTYIDRRTWKRGVKWCRWLSLFWPDRVRESLDIRFSKEVGSRKGSWKGGTLGHGIDLLPGELHLAAFQRYAAQHQLTDVRQLEGDRDD
jgi:hypothetical protein